MIEIREECSACEGTGIYVGMCERGGAGVVCSSCRGKGYRDITIKKFTERKKRNGVKRIYERSSYVLNAEDVTTEEGKFLPFSEFGCSYEEWLKGGEPKRITFLGCPMQMDQGSCHELKGFVNKCNLLNKKYLGVLSNCENMKNKAECWVRFLQGEKKDD